MARFVSEKHDWLESHPNADLASWRAYVHEELEWDLLHMNWMPLVCQVHQLTLRYLEVNVQNCTCPCGCYDQVSWAMGWLADWEGAPPGELVVLGTRSSAQRAEIRAIVGNRTLEGLPVLRFEMCLDAGRERALSE